MRATENAIARIPVPESDVDRQAQHRPSALTEGLQRAFDEDPPAPLANIALATSILEPQVKVTLARRVQAITRAAGELDRMLRDVRDFAICASQEGLRLARRTTDMRVVCERVLEEAKSLYPAAPVELTCAA